MLVLTRKLNQSIQIGEEIEVKVVSIDGDQIKLGISAPKEVDIYRKEIYLEIQKENNQAIINEIDVLDFLKKNQKNI
ncbi:carbon storage regulator CsrA [Amphibacillus sediminis]|uniref:carbon storage regulator CsrA n=1 Tax=Amphibacillus sediminis TaxID=360185 RepID=UPI0008364447|nr:carbon storage regulator CsrA [Amphibacillus sediminis]